MNAKLFALTLVGALAISASAQEEVAVKSDFLKTTPAKDVSFKPTNRGWFFNLLGGANYGLGQSKIINNYQFSDRIGYGAGIGVGKWHNPYFGTRVMVDWNWLTNPYRLPEAVGATKGAPKAHSINPHFDFLFDVTNFFAPYNAERTFHFVPYVGVGYMGTQRLRNVGELTKTLFKDLDILNSVSANAGINMDIRLGKSVALTIAPSVALANIYDLNYYEPIEFLPQLRAGLTFGVAQGGFEGVEPMDYELLNTLQDEINSLRSQNTELSKRPVSCPECPEVKPQVVQPMIQGIVYFRIDSSKIDRNQLINIYNVAEYVKANNTPIVVTGYADEKTGTSNYNLKLSEKRAQRVADTLINEYGVPSNLITIDHKGDTVQPYSTNAWNRVVIMKTK